MQRTNLDLDTLRTLVLAYDLGGYGHAATRLGRTPSAISLQMKRLQTDVGATMFRKNGRAVALTEAGEIVLRYARRMLALNDELLDTVRGASLVGRVSVGVSQDFAESVLPAALSQFTKLYPLVQMDVRIEGNVALVDAVEQGELDLALAVGQAHRATGVTVGALDLVWIAGQDFAPRGGQPLPLVVLGPQCAFRKEAVRVLESAQMPWRVAAVSPSLAGLWATAVAGLGVTVRSAMSLPSTLVWGKSLFDLPALGAFPVTIHAPASGSSAGAERLRAILTDVVSRTL
jgi:DNA-binding transcriptional LysR family regulator